METVTQNTTEGRTERCACKEKRHTKMKKTEWNRRKTAVTPYIEAPPQPPSNSFVFLVGDRMWYTYFRPIPCSRLMSLLLKPEVPPYDSHSRDTEGPKSWSQLPEITQLNHLSLELKPKADGTKSALLTKLLIQLFLTTNNGIIQISYSLYTTLYPLFHPLSRENESKVI